MINYDYEIHNLKDKVRQLERLIDDLEYKVRRLEEEKADVNHRHRQYTLAEDTY